MKQTYSTYCYRQQKNRVYHIDAHKAKELATTDAQKHLAAKEVNQYFAKQHVTPDLVIHFRGRTVVLPTIAFSQNKTIHRLLKQLTKSW